VEALKIDNFKNLINLAFDFEKSKMENRRFYYEKLYNEDLTRLERLNKIS
jgi:hypothetical protein